MKNAIELRVLYRDSEHVLKLCNDDGQWHAALLMPGRKYLLTGECPVPSAPGTILPKADEKNFMLKVEVLEVNVEAIGMARLIASGSVTMRDGWIMVPLRSLACNYYGGIRDKMPAQEHAEILNFPTGRGGRTR